MELVCVDEQVMFRWRVVENATSIKQWQRSGKSHFTCPVGTDVHMDRPGLSQHSPCQIVALYLKLPTNSGHVTCPIILGQAQVVHTTLEVYVLMAVKCGQSEPVG